MIVEWAYLLAGCYVHVLNANWLFITSNSSDFWVRFSSKDRRTLTSLPALDAPQGQDVLLVGEELLHLVEGLLAADGQLAPGFGACQDLAD